MNRKDEDRILHGLHYYRETLDEEFSVTSGQILWLAVHAVPDGGRWETQGGALQRFDLSVVPPELGRKLLASKVELPLRYLQYRRLIKLTRLDEETMSVAVTFAGADRAMRLHTRYGRLEVWYSEHRDGFFGLAITVGVSFITAMVACALSDHLRHGLAEQPRIIYEVVPKSSP